MRKAKFAKTLLNITLSTILLLPGQGIWAQQNSQQINDPTGTESFLNRMGFTGNPGSDHELIVARDLAKLIMERAKEENQEALIKMIVRLLQVQPLAIAEEYPNEIKSEANPVIRKQMIENYVKTTTRKKTQELLSHLVSDIMSSIYKVEDLSSANSWKAQADLARITELMDLYLTRVMQDPAKRNTQYLGRGVLLSAIRKARLQKNKDFEKQLREAALGSGIDIDLYISNKIKVLNDKKKTVEVLIQDGETVLDHEIQTRDFDKDVLSRMDKGEKPNLIERARFWFNQTKMANFGFNATYKALVTTDKETGLQTIWLKSENIQTGIEQLDFDAQMKVGKQKISLPRQTIISRYANQFSGYAAPMDQKMHSMIYPTLVNARVLQTAGNGESLQHLYKMQLLLMENAVNLGVAKLSALAWFKYNPDKVASSDLSTTPTTYDPSLQLDPAAKAKLIAEYRQHLINLGFENLAEQMLENLKKENYFYEADRRQLKRNLKSYSAMQNGVDLALEIVTQMYPSLQKSEVARAKLAEFTAKMMALRALNPITKFPAHVEAEIKAGNEEARYDYLYETMKQQMETHTRQILSDVLELLYGEKLVKDIKNRLATNPQDAVALKWKSVFDSMYGKVWRIVERTYMDVQVGRSALFGSALAALVERASYDTGKADLLTKLEQETRRQDMLLTDFLGEEYVSINEKGKTESIKVRNGAMILTRYLQMESFAIGVGTTSAFPDREKEFKLKSSVLLAAIGAFMIKTPDAAHDGYSFTARLQDLISQLNLNMNRNYSHVGTIDLKKSSYVDHQGQKRTSAFKWVLDTYPAPVADITEDLANSGGSRLNTLNEFINRGKHSRAYIANVNPTEFRKHARMYIEKNKQAAREAIARGEKPKHSPETGYPTDGNVINDAYKLEWDGNNPIKNENPERDPIKMAITEEEFVRLHSIKNDEEWYEKMAEGMNNEQRRYVTEGNVFLWVIFGVHANGMNYCSEQRNRSMFARTGIPLDMYPGDYIEAVKKLGRIGLDLKKAIDAIDNNKEITDSKRAEFFKKLLVNKPDLRTKIEGILASGAMGEAMNAVKLAFIVVPNSLAVQPFILKEETKEFDFKNRQMGDRWKTNFNPYNESNSKITDLVESILPRSDVYKYGKFAIRNADKTEIINVDFYTGHYQEAQVGIYGKMSGKPVGEAVVSKFGSGTHTPPTVTAGSKCEMVFVNSH